MESMLGVEVFEFCMFHQASVLCCRARLLGETITDLIAGLFALLHVTSIPESDLDLSRPVKLPLSIPPPIPGVGS